LTKFYSGQVGNACYSNVFHTGETTAEIYFDKRFFPSYLWVFPLPGNLANVGFSMLSGEIAKRKFNLRKAFYGFIEQSPELKRKFKDAVQVSPPEGFGLPLGSKVPVISGERFMLTGGLAYRHHYRRRHRQCHAERQTCCRTNAAMLPAK